MDYNAGMLVELRLETRKGWWKQKTILNDMTRGVTAYLPCLMMFSKALSLFYSPECCEWLFTTAAVIPMLSNLAGLSSLADLQLSSIDANVG